MKLGVIESDVVLVGSAVLTPAEREEQKAFENEWVHIQDRPKMPLTIERFCSEGCGRLAESLLEDMCNRCLAIEDAWREQGCNF